MSLFSLPAHIHVDPNMHPRLYDHLLHFALVFDKVSLYAVSGAYLSRPSSPLNVNEFIELIRDPKESPFLLTGPSDWFQIEQRRARLNQNVVGWHEYDDRIVNEVGLDKVLLVSSSLDIRNIAWDEALRYHDLIVSERLDSDDYDGPPHKQMVNRAYLKAKTLYSEDQKEHQKRLSNSENEQLAELSYDGVLPATLYHKIVHTKNYSDLLREGDALSCLIFEHCTKPHIIKAIENELPRDSKYRLAMYVPDEWHQLLLGGQSLSSSADFIKMGVEEFELAYARFALEEIEKLFRDRPTGIEGRQTVEEIKEFRRRGMPAVLRNIIQRNLDRLIVSRDAKGLQAAMRQSVQDMVRLCKSTRIRSMLTRIVVESIIVGCIFGGGALVGWSETISGGAALFELTRKDVGNFMIEKWMEKIPSGKQQYLLESLNRWLHSGQPTRSIRDRT